MAKSAKYPFSSGTFCAGMIHRSELSGLKKHAPLKKVRYKDLTQVGGKLLITMDRLWQTFLNPGAP